MVAKNMMSYVITITFCIQAKYGTIPVKTLLQFKIEYKIPTKIQTECFQLRWLQNPLIYILCRSTMEMLFSVGKIVVVLRLLASHVFWIVSFIKVS